MNVIMAYLPFPLQLDIYFVPKFASMLQLQMLHTSNKVILYTHHQQQLGTHDELILHLSLTRKLENFRQETEFYILFHIGGTQH